MSRYKRYEKYKDSGVEWIGEIPEHWGIIKLKHISNITMGQSPKSEECNLDGIGLPFLQGNAEFARLYPRPKMYCNTANKFSKVNDILLSVRAPVGAMNLSDRVYGIGRGLCAITAKKVIMKYLWYSLNVSVEELFIRSKGSTFEAVTVTDVSNLLSILPSKKEQIAIANFLDQKTAEIDDLIADKEKMIQLLKEKRQAIISEVVTKGLDRNVPMKDSGVEWIGKIPERWETSKIKYIAKYFFDGDWIESPYITDEGIRLIQTGNIDVGRYKEQGYRYISKKTFYELKCKEVYPNDILICRLAQPVGRACLAPNLNERMVAAVDICILRPKNNIDRRYAVYYFSCNGYLEETDNIARGSTRQRISRTQLGNIIILLPSFEEQTAIANFLDQKTTEIDSLISDIKTQIQKLKEYRQSLIFEAVTGKIDVRDYVVD